MRQRLWLLLSLGNMFVGDSLPTFALRISSLVKDQTVASALGDYFADGLVNGATRYRLHSDTVTRFLYQTRVSKVWSITGSEEGIAKSKGTLVSTTQGTTPGSPVGLTFRYYTAGQWFVDESLFIQDISPPVLDDSATGIATGETWVVVVALILTLFLAMNFTFIAAFVLARHQGTTRWHGLSVTIKDTSMPIATDEPTALTTDDGSSSALLAHPEAEKHKGLIRLPLLEEAFKAADVDASGSISDSELMEFGQFIGGKQWTAEDVTSALKTHDRNHDGAICFGEFQDFCYEQTKHISSSVLQAMIHSYVEVRALGKERKEMIEEVYRKIDVEGIGYVERESMEEFGRFMNPHLDKEKFERLMDQMDLDKSGQIGPNEFLGYFAKLSKSTRDAAFKKAFAKYRAFERSAKPVLRERRLGVVVAG